MLFPQTLTRSLDLTGSTPTALDHGLSGVSHALDLETAYYEATVPIWIDIIDEKVPEAWSADFLVDEASEVLQALGGYVLAFPKPVTQADYADLKNIVKEVGNVVKKAERKGWDGVLLVVLMKQDVVPRLEVPMEEWEDFGIENGGWEVVDAEVEAGKNNEFGEKTGWERVKEALEANNWDGGDGDGEVDLKGLELGLEEIDEGDFGIDEEIRLEMERMKQPINNGAVEETEDIKDEAQDVEDMEQLIGRIQAMHGKLCYVSL